MSDCSLPSKLPLASKIKGKLAGDTLSEKFQTLYGGKVVDTGAWKTERRK